MESFHKNLIKFNDRDVQDLNRRALYVSAQYSFSSDDANNDSSKKTASNGSHKTIFLKISIISMLMFVCFFHTEKSYLIKFF